METGRMSEPKRWSDWPNEVCSNGNHKHVFSRSGAFKMCLSERVWWAVSRG